jgi:hypothetical protein
MFTVFGTALKLFCVYPPLTDICICSCFTVQFQSSDLDIRMKVVYVRDCINHRQSRPFLELDPCSYKLHILFHQFTSDCHKRLHPAPEYPFVPVAVLTIRLVSRVKIGLIAHQSPAKMTKRPLELERNVYYYGLPSQPILVARSSDSAWAPRYHRGRGPELIEKFLSNVGSHQIVDMWNDGGALRDDILDAISPLEWHSVDILRIGYEASDSFPILHLRRPVALFITVQPGSVRWMQAYPIALRCKQILQRAEIFDVDCEIKEGQFFTAGQQASSSATSHSTNMETENSAETFDELAVHDRWLLQRLPDQVDLKLDCEQLVTAMNSVGVEAPEDLDQHVSLEGTIPEDELTSHGTGFQGLLVGKRGKATELTFGFANEALSLVRRPDCGTHKYSEEWCIVGIGGEFARPDDSGAFVWEGYAPRDGKRRIAGRIASGVGSIDRGEWTITYATPIERLLDHAGGSSLGEFGGFLLGYLGMMMGNLCGGRRP